MKAQSLRRLLMLAPLLAILAAQAGIAESEDTADAPEEIRASKPDPRDGEVLRWLDRLREAHPEEFARLRRLREAHPEKFREEMRRRIERRIAESRAAAGAARGEPGDPRRGGPPLPRLERDPDIARLERELIALTREFHAAAPADRREELRTRIRALLREALERREAQWAARIQKMRRELAELEKQMERWRAKRDEIIEQRLRMLLETPAPVPSPAPAEGPPPAREPPPAAPAT